MVESKKSTTAPVVTVVQSSVTSNSISVTATAIEPESSVTGYFYSLDDGATWSPEQGTNTYTFTGLADNTNYEIVARAKNSSLLTGESTMINVTTTTIGVPTLIAAPAGWTNTDKTITITYPARQTGVIYEYQINTDGWVEVTDPDVTEDVVISANGSVSARATDGTNTESDTINITTIDKVDPTVAFVTNGGAGESAETVVNISETDSLIDTLEYAWDNTTTTPVAGWTSFNSGDNLTKAVNGTWYLHIRALDNAGNQEDIYSNAFVITIVDVTAPVVTVAQGTLTSNSISVVATAVEPESTVIGYFFSSDNGNTWSPEQGTNTYTFTNLTHDTSYNIKARAKNSESLTGESGTESISTTAIALPTFVALPAGWTNTDKTITITYPARQTGFVYEYQINAGGWVELTSPDITYDAVLSANGTVFARVTDGTNEESDSINITTIDKLNPAVTFVTNGGSGVSASTVVNIVEIDSLIDTLEYAFTNNTTTPSSGWTSFNSGDDLVKVEIGMWYLHIRAIDNAGNQEDVYSNSFDVTGTAPLVTLPTVIDVTATTATLGATVAINASSPITEHGTCWGTASNPTTNCVADGGGIPTFTQDRTSLPSETTIYYRGYAINGVGTGYSSDDTFTTSSLEITLLANGYWSYTGTAPTTTTYENINNTIASYDATYFVAGANSTGTAFYNIANMPGDFTNMVTLDFDIRYGITPVSGDTETLSIQIFKSDGTTPLTNSMLIESTTSTVAETNFGVTAFTGLDTSATKAEWDTAVIAIITTHSKDKGADGSVWSINEIEFYGLYE